MSHDLLRTSTPQFACGSGRTIPDRPTAAGFRIKLRVVDVIVTHAGGKGHIRVQLLNTISIFDILLLLLHLRLKIVLREI